MQSPFKLLRKHQRWIMVGVAVIIMVSFGVGDVMTRMTRSGRNPGSEVIIESDAGSLTRLGLQELTRRRHLANLFMFRAVVAVNPQFEKLPPQFLGRLAQRFGAESRSNVVFAWLLRHEAARMGLVVDDERIGRFIDQETSNKLSTEQFRRIARELNLSDKDIYDILGDELLATDVYQLTFPITTHTPEQYWKFYQQLHTRQKIEVAALPVKDFVAKVDAPSDAEITTLFEKHKARFESSSEGEYKPGFRQQQKAQLQYLHIAYEDVEARVLKERPITDKDIEDYYESKKLIDRRLWEVETPAETGDSAPIDPDIAPEGGEKPQGPSLEPGAGPEPKPSTPEADRPEAPSTPGEEPSVTEPEEKSKQNGACGPVPGADDEEAQPAVEERPAVDEKPAQEPSESEKPAEGDKSDPASTGDKPAPTEEEEPTGEQQKKPKPEIRLPKFRPLDDALRTEIREYIATDRTTARVEEVSKAAAEALRDVSLRLAQRKDFDLTRLKPEQAPLLIEIAREEMQKIAEKFGLTFGETKLVGPQELSELPDIGKAREKDANDFSPEGPRSILNLVFENDALCRVLEAVGGGDKASDRYVFWKVQDVPAHVPKLDEPGVREQVIEAWKLLQAAPLARKRGEALAEAVRKAGGKMSEPLSGQTVTGVDKDAAIVIQESPEFSWWRESLVPQTGMGRPPVQLGNPVVVTAAGLKFMTYVFDELKEGETGVVFNDDGSVCYVVTVVERRPADREQFKNAPVFSPFSPYGKLAEFEQQVLGSEFFRQFEKRYGLKSKEIEAALADDDMEE